MLVFLIFLQLLRFVTLTLQSVIDDGKKGGSRVTARNRLWLRPLITTAHVLAPNDVTSACIQEFLALFLYSRRRRRRGCHLQVLTPLTERLSRLLHISLHILQQLDTETCEAFLPHPSVRPVIMGQSPSSSVLHSPRRASFSRCAQWNKRRAACGLS